MQSSLISISHNLADFGDRELYWTTPMLTGEDVRYVQQVTGTTPDGIFGPKTHHAVIEWKAGKGLPADGVVDAGTWQVMKELNPPETSSNEPFAKRTNGYMFWVLGGIAAIGTGIIIANQ